MKYYALMSFAKVKLQIFAPNVRDYYFQCLYTIELDMKHIFTEYGTYYTLSNFTIIAAIYKVYCNINSNFISNIH